MMYVKFVIGQSKLVEIFLLVKIKLNVFLSSFIVIFGVLIKNPHPAVLATS